MNADLKQQVEDVLAEWRNSDDDLFSFEETCDRMAALLQELVDAPEPEPVARVTGYYAGYLSIATVDGRVLPAGTAVYTSPPAPSVPDVLPATNPSQISSFTEPVEWLPGGFRIEHFTKDDPMLTDEANAERRFFVTRIESPYPKDGVWFGATAGAALAKACAALGIEYADALAGVSTEHLEQYGLPDFAQKISDLAQQRDKLLAVLEQCLNMVGHPDNIAFIDAAIAEVKGGA